MARPTRLETAFIPIDVAMQVRLGLSTQNKGLCVNVTMHPRNANEFQQIDGCGIV